MDQWWSEVVRMECGCVEFRVRAHGVLYIFDRDECVEHFV